MNDWILNFKDVYINNDGTFIQCGKCKLFTINKDGHKLLHELDCWHDISRQQISSMEKINVNLEDFTHYKLDTLNNDKLRVYFGDEKFISLERVNLNKNQKIIWSLLQENHNLKNDNSDLNIINETLTEMAGLSGSLETPAEDCGCIGDKDSIIES